MKFVSMELEHGISLGDNHKKETKLQGATVRKCLRNTHLKDIGITVKSVVGIILRI